MIDRIKNLNKIKFSFGKNSDYFHTSTKKFNAYCWLDPGYGLDVPAYLGLENKIRAVFKIIVDNDGIFLFNISGVNINIARRGFSDFTEAYSNNYLTEWELSLILVNQDYYIRTIFHNGVNEFRISNNGIKIVWN